MHSPPASASIRTILPLAFVTGVSMAAMDLYLPAVPALQAGMGISVPLAQATVAVYLAGLAGAQLLWGELLNRLGPRRSIEIGLLLLVLTSLGCALAPNIETLLVLRLLQGVSAAAATVVAPTVVRATLADADVVRGIAAISMVEAIVPAAGPVLGALMLRVTDWRGTFWVLAALALLVLPWVVKIAPRKLPGLNLEHDAGYFGILRNRSYLRLAGSHALCIGALLTFLASAPQLLQHTLGLGTAAFALLQVLGVGSFMIGASQSGKLAARLGHARVVRLGSVVQLVACTVALLLAWSGAQLPYAVVAAYWMCFCGALAIRGPATFVDALALPPAQMGRATALLVLALLAVGALGTQLVAPFLGHADSAVPVFAGVLIQLLVSAALVWRYPAVRQSSTA
ncbi:DHA1 family bicyclomycin/chloramphenicol resistance-like MFS transporter [Pelomonas saccharophila]|uniref:DHA1 family bicyclomycin/chloramphenicol resistance-like MFS transporter n=1 Tax=Roseateles saccharophilus TaxID=304 RepID=A0ABU1YFU4_ROSSA|nr:MFS transporter [Roseateles saccharophilus]MDR7267720.1 DHA1 family bicyclomycin/chloramphenicol resistance-like MFS transporter [Roseateles saccharophilus]